MQPRRPPWTDFLPLGGDNDRLGPAIDRGTNQPNVFFDPKSSESFTPYFSRGWRDDAIQRAYLEASYLWWGQGANNPVSSVCQSAWKADPLSARNIDPARRSEIRAWADGTDHVVKAGQALIVRRGS